MIATVQGHYSIFTLPDAGPVVKKKAGRIAPAGLLFRVDTRPYSMLPSVSKTYRSAASASRMKRRTFSLKPSMCTQPLP